MPSPFMGIISPSSGRSQTCRAVAHRQHFREKHTICPFAALRGLCLIRTMVAVRLLGCDLFRRSL